MLDRTTPTYPPLRFSPQQQAVFDWVSNGRGSAFVEAVAGAGKTTTIIEACRRMRGSIGAERPARRHPQPQAAGAPQ